MYCTMLGMASFMNWRGGLKTAWGIGWFAVGGILGWPFSMALSLPFLVEEIILATLSSKEAFIDTIIRTGRGVIAGILILVSRPLSDRIILLKEPVRSSNSSSQASSTRRWSWYLLTLFGTTSSAEPVVDQKFTALSHGISTSEIYS